MKVKDALSVSYDALSVTYAEIQKITTFQWNVLNLLVERDSYGMGIAKVIADKSNDEVYKEPGSLYPALDKLYKNGYLDKYNDNPQPKCRESRSRKMYRITRKGRDALFLFEKQNRDLKNRSG